uniref:Uncharacterized protein n=1 Tax=Salix viminalis TaxID=40686 RepID=A0A6N2LUK1_SALVM
MASTPPESPSNSVINKLLADGNEYILELRLETASFGCILRLKNAVNDEFLQDLLRKVMKTVFFNGEIKFDMSQEECARFILDHLVALARADAWFLINCCSGTYHFVENCTSNMLDPYLDEIITRKQLLKQWALSALAAIAKSSQDRFLEYYRTIMPYLNFVMMKARGESNGLLLSTTISCMTAIWTVIGKDKFSDDTQQAVQLLASTPISNLDIHDPMIIQGLKGSILAPYSSLKHVSYRKHGADFANLMPTFWRAFLSHLNHALILRNGKDAGQLLVAFII